MINAQCRNGRAFFLMRYRNLRNNTKKNQFYFKSVDYQTIGAVAASKNYHKNQGSETGSNRVKPVITERGHFFRK